MSANPQEQMSFIETIRALSSDILSRRRWSGNMGKTHDGDRDMHRAFGYPVDITPQDFRREYERNGLAARVVEALPKSTWRGGAEIVETEDPDEETAFEKEVQKLNQRVNLWSIFQRTDILSGIGHYGILLIGAGGNLNTPLPRMRNSDDILYLTPFGEDEAPVDTYELNSMNPRFGQPLFYRLQRADPSKRSPARLVHHSRVVHVADGLLDDHVFAPPRLERIYNRLLDLEKVVGGGAEAFWMRADQGMQFDLDPAIVLDAAGEEALKTQVEEYRHRIRRILTTQGVDIKPLGSDVADFSSPSDNIISLISAGTGIPQRILMGSERGELSSTQDKTNWDERVMDRRDEFAKPRVIDAFIRTLMACGALPKVEEWDVWWPTIRNLTEDEKATLALKYAQVNQTQGEVVIETNEIRDKVFEWEPLDEIRIIGDTGEEDDDADLEDENIRAASEKALRLATRYSTRSRQAQKALRTLGRADARRRKKRGLSAEA